MVFSRLHEATEMITHMEPDLYRAAVNGKIDVFTNNEDNLEGLLTPTKNTILHIYLKAKPDQEISAKPTKFVEEILHKCPPLLLQANIDGDIPLHIAARHGHTPIVKVLIKHAKTLGMELCRDMMRMRNSEEDTALHEALRFKHLGVAWMLAKQDDEIMCFVNNVGETPLHIAVKGGYCVFVLEILRKNSISNTTVYGGPNGKTLLHEAVICNDEEMTRAILTKMGNLSKQADQQGWTPLHYAADLGNLSMVKALLEFDRYAVYMKDKDGKVPLQIAACHSYLEIIKEIISWCPDSSELVDIGGISNDTVLDILQNPSLHNVLQGKDEENGITSLSAPNNHPDISQSRRDEEKLPAFGMWIEEQQMQRDDTSSDQPILLQKNDEEGYRKNESPSNSGVDKAKEATLIVAALISTVTFAAGFTLPGGYVSDGSPQQGTAILRKNLAFKTFIITDTIAMVFSSSAVFIHLFLALKQERSRVLSYFLMSFRLTMFAMAAMVVAFVTGIYAVLGHSSALAIATCVIGLSFFGWFHKLLTSHIDDCLYGLCFETDHV